MKISSSEFLNLAHPVASHRWSLPVVPRTTGGRGSLFGGVGLAAGIVALEQASARPVVWATGQYLALTQQPVDLDLSVTLPAVGRSVTQGRVVGSLDEREIITVFGAAGARPAAAQGVWAEMPRAADPLQSQLLERQHDGPSVHDHMEVRIARGMFGFSGAGTPSGDGQSLLWVRMPGVQHDPGALAIMADYMPSALGNALGHIAHCTSLDNTIRFAQHPSNHPDSEWVLCENQMEYVGDGFGYGSCRMWSDQGQLLATASQSMIVRVPA